MIYEIQISYPGTELDQQVKIDLSKTNLNINRLKFYDIFGNTIPHWNEDETNTWVKVPILNGMTKIYVDDSASKDLSNIDELFYLFETFEDSTSHYNWILTDNSLYPHEHTWNTDPTNNTTNNNFIPYEGAHSYYNGDEGDPTDVKYSLSISIPLENNELSMALLLNRWTGTGVSGLIEVQLLLDNNITLHFRLAQNNTIPTNTSTDYYYLHGNIINNTFIFDKYNFNELGFSSSKITTIGFYYYKNDSGTGFIFGIDALKISKYLPSSPKILYIKPYHKQNYITNTIFNENKNILNYNIDSYIETPVIENVDNLSTQNIVTKYNKSIYYLRGSNIQPDITYSGIINNEYKYWDSNTITNSGWNNTIPSDYTTYSSNNLDVIDKKYIQFKIKIS